MSISTASGYTKTYTIFLGIGGLDNCMKRKISIALSLMALSFSSTLLSAVGYFEYSPLAIKTYDRIFSLRFQEARSDLVTLRITEPDNLITNSLANYMD
ncbi:MAG: hypothetical protein IPL46_11055 [Saprospiraceae bacterium]|nr:hypothetical protein [Saprospiraceae bacterium]